MIRWRSLFAVVALLISGTGCNAILSNELHEVVRADSESDATTDGPDSGSDSFRDAFVYPDATAEAGEAANDGSWGGSDGLADSGRLANDAMLASDSPAGDGAACSTGTGCAAMCRPGDTMSCGHRAIGICHPGTETCNPDGTWSACIGEQGPKVRDCTSPLDNDCDGKADNTLDAACQCTGGTQACGAHSGLDGKGACAAGAQTCMAGVWSMCVGSVGPSARDCTSAKDNDCDGKPDNTIDAVCQCAIATSQTCGAHPGTDGVGICHAGSQKCAGMTGNSSSAFLPCTGSVGPSARDCTSPLDNNCDGKPDNAVDAMCQCTNGASQACATHPGKDGNGICKAGKQTCAAQLWSTCTGSVGPAARDCTSAADNNCDGSPDDTIDATCQCAIGTSQACNAHPGLDGHGACRSGSRACLAGAGNATTQWATQCTGDIGPSPRDCASFLDNDCNGTPDNRELACVCATVQAPTITVGHGGGFCPGQSVTLTSSAASSYAWSNAATTPSITVSTPGMFSVTTTDPNGCQATASVTVTAFPQPSAPMIAGPLSFCAGGNVVLTGPAGAASYLWSTGGTSRSITVNASGNYTLSITDSHGCGATGSAPVTETFAGSGHQDFTNVGVLSMPFTAPPCVTAVTIIARGGKGGDSGDFGIGGAGAIVQATIPVVPNQAYSVFVGSMGTASCQNSGVGLGPNRGGAAGCSHPGDLLYGSGGGASKFVEANTGKVLLVAAGGGGAGDFFLDLRDGGGSAAANGSSGGSALGMSLEGGGGASTAGPGTGGSTTSGGFVNAGGDGAKGIGGAGGQCQNTVTHQFLGAGGGGGGGFFGGGGGCAAGGGGGSSFVDPGGTAVSYSPNSFLDGDVFISW